LSSILVLTNWYPPHHTGGYELSCSDVMTRLAARGHDVRVLCGDERLPGAGEPDPEHERRVHRELALYVRGGDLYRPPVRERLEIERHNRVVLQRHLADHQPDVVSVWHMGGVSLGLLRNVADAGYPIVYAVCDDWLTYGHKLDAWSDLYTGNPLRAAFGRAVEASTGVSTRVPDLGADTAFCFVSESTRRRSIAAGRWSYPRSTVVYSGIERSEFLAVEPGEARPWQGRLVYSGRFDPRKGMETVLRALLLVPEVTLECYGRGGHGERARLESLARELGVADRVRFGMLERADLAARYRDADVVLFPSEWEEPFGLVPVEGMACGTPVAATGTGGSREFLRDGFNCVLFRPGDPQSLAAAVGRLRDDPALREKVVRGGLHTAAELDVDRLADTFEAWHEAAAARFAHGIPSDRELDLPAPVDPLARHQAAAPDVIAGGDPDAVKRLYVDLGDDWWRAQADDLDGIPVLSAPETHPVVAECLDQTRGLLLDAGCGPNPELSMRLAASPARTVVSLDIGFGTVRVARAVATRRGFDLIGVVGDAEQLPFREGAFAGVACDDTIEHLPDDTAAVSEIARVLVPEGTAVLATPNRHDARVVRAKLRDLFRGIHKPADAYYCSNSHLREYTWREFERLVQRAFRVHGRHPVGWSRGRKARLASMFVRLGPLRELSQMIVVEVQPAASNGHEPADHPRPEAGGSGIRTPGPRVSGGSEVSSERSAAS
jgi:glycogen(starch) synthase